MAYCTLESEVIDTLEILRPPVKRNNLFKNKTNIGLNSTNPSRKLNRKEITRHNKPKIKEPVESSNYIQKENSEKRVLEHHSVVGYTNVFKHKRQALPVQTENHHISKEKPLIQVTVIPKTELIQTGKFSKRRRHYTKVQSSHSNQENSINGKEVYVVTSGKTREKINEIKTTVSANYFNKRIIKIIKHEENISICKQLLESLNMEVKKKRDKRKKKPAKVEAIDDTREKCYDCGCWENTRNEIQPDLRQHKSRVRIYGRVGLSQDDRYVVDCAATVDENPMPTTNYSPIEHNPEVSSIFIASNDHPRFSRNINKVGCSSGAGNNYRPYQRDFNTQTDVRDDITQFYLFGANRPWLGKASQGTQVNFNISFPNVNNKHYYQTKEQKIQCECDNLIGTSSPNQIKNNVDESQSPLVIISVYPKKESIDVIKPVTCCKGNNTASTSPSKSPTSSPERTRTSSPKKNREIPSSKAVSRSCSPSPVAKYLYKRKEDINKKLEETKVFRAGKRQVSPNYQTTLASQNIRKVDRKSVVANKRNNNCKTEPTWNTETNQNTTRSAEKRTEQMLAKQALVNDFTKRITESMNRKPVYDLNTLKNGASKVTVNINSENEHYDVMFQQGKLTTDLSVRRNKKVSPRRDYDQMDGQRSPPPTVFERESNGNWRDNVNKTQANAGIHEQNVSRLNVRDSLEILHRRETEQNTSITKPYPKHKRRYDNTIDNQFLAPIKHYRGDDCNLPNPIERDKQIRELLGIEQRVVSSSETPEYQEYNVDRNEDGYLRCVIKECTKYLPMNITNPKECISYNCRYKDFSKEPTKPDEENTGDQQITTKNTRENSTQYDQGPVERNLYQQLILKRNIQVFLQVDQFNKQKPIILSRQQYYKVKRTIQDTINKKSCRGSKGKKCYCKTSMVSIDEVREKTKQEVSEPTEEGVQATKNKETKIGGRKSSKLLDWMKKEKDDVKEMQALLLVNSNEKISSSGCNNSKDLNTIPRKTVSSVEIRYANLGMKRVQFSRSNLASETTSHIGQPRSDSLVTIYKGPRKSITPNLGTSIISEGVSNSKSVQFLMAPGGVKQKKPFLQRLISCLVGHSTRDTALKMPHKSIIPLTPSVNSSIDSYQISSSLGEIEITSSLYDTSASFYSNHSIWHVNSKMKRGFFSSVREFLTSRKS